MSKHLLEPEPRASGKKMSRLTRTYRGGYFVGSLSSTSINRTLSRSLIRLAPEDLEFTEIPIGDLPLYNRDLDTNYPPEATALKEAIARSDAVLFVTPEYNRSIPGGLKNAIDWASRPYGDSAWEGKPLAIMGASPGQSGTVRAQLQLRQAAIFLNMLPLNRPEVLVGRQTPSLTPASISPMKRPESSSGMNWKPSPGGLKGSAWGWERWPHPGS